MFSNQTLIVLSILGFLMTLIGLMLSSYTSIENGDFLFTVGLWLIEIPGLFLLLRNGTFIKTRYSRISLGLVALILVGMIFKIMHWSFQNLFTVIGCLGIIFSYLMHFVQKPIKKRLDYLKLIWVIIRFVGFIFVMLRVLGGSYQMITALCMMLILLEYKLSNVKR
ncbi:hypothetical protein [uncultured Aquimarina sp.]|uniref:hypothetical protein n=1 Tax=uncultured Aquimarina sp. TaxID=575652 RepID=UPI002634EC17|nr:hypothetical protein [uncultured Aquimarina sp.]